MVGFDTTIPPGREGSITEEVSMAKMHDGAFSKCLTVSSNAKNKPDMRLCIKGTVKVALAVSPSYAQMKRDSSGKFSLELTLTTEKPNLQVKEVTFKANSTAQGQTAWQTNLPSYCMFKLIKPEKPNNDGSWTYKLLLTYTAEEKENKFGDFVIATNHPETPEVRASGTIDVTAAPPKK